MNSPATPQTALATFGGGCFWCLDAVFRPQPGVLSVVSGYAGGTVPNPTYRDVCNGTTGHAEVVQITFDPNLISYDALLQLFWQVHDPTQLNRQGADIGTQYRSVIFYHDPDQKQSAKTSRDTLNASGQYPRPIVTVIAEAPPFYPAEKEHQNFYQDNPHVPYSQFVIAPKLEKLHRKSTH